jgi:hypothetical protein
VNIFTALMGFLSGAVGIELVRRFFDWIEKRRAARELRANTELSVSSNVQVARITQENVMLERLWTETIRQKERAETAERANLECERKILRLESEIAELRETIVELEERNGHQQNPSAT